jgi:hypothetical protein
VVDDTGRLVGVVSREALLATVPGRRPPSDEPDARR